MAELTEQEYEAACERGSRMFEIVPLARSACYDRRTKRMVLELTNGSTFTFLPVHVQRLEQASPEQLDAVEISGGGYGLHWDVLDADYSVAGLLAGRFGSADYMKQFAKSHAA
jgi:hypothetical protein